MANVQLENGFTRIADALLEAMCRVSISGRNSRVFIALIRLTYGFNKTSDRIATSQISTLTGIERRSVTRILKDLEAAGMVTRGPLERGRARRLAVVKDFDRWEGSPPSGAPPATPAVNGTHGSAARGGVAHKTPLVGSSLPPSKEIKTISKERAPARGSDLRSSEGKTPCPEKLSASARAKIRAWRDEHHAGKFSDLELAAQWMRFLDHHRSRKNVDGDWGARFRNWLTHEHYRPLTNGGGGGTVAAIKIHTASREGPPTIDPQELARAIEESREVRKQAGLDRRTPPGRLRTSLDRVGAR